MLTYIFEFLLKYSIYLKFLKIKNKKFKKFKNNSIFLKNRQKTTKKTAKKIYLSQLLITYCNS
jgi:hypothetical protein